MNKPIAVYDKDTGEVYAVHNDGKREELNEKDIANEKIIEYLKTHGKMFLSRE